LEPFEAASIPETAFTLWTNLYDGGRLKKRETVRLHGGASGIGTMAIQIAKSFGARVVVTADPMAKCTTCRELGADVAINYRTEDFVERVMSFTGGRGVDVILDMVGGDYIQRNIDVAAHGGRIVMIGFIKSYEERVSFLPIMMKRLILTGSTLRSRSVQEKAHLASTVEAEIWPLIADGRIRPVVERVFPLTEAASVHACMSQGDHTGKLALAP